MDIMELISQIKSSNKIEFSIELIKTLTEAYNMPIVVVDDYILDLTYLLSNSK